MKTLLNGAAIALTLAAMPASAQLLGGGGGLGGSLAGSLGGMGGGIGGMGGGSLGGMIDHGRLSGDGVLSNRTSTRTDRSVDARKGHVKASNSTATESTLDGATTIGNRSLGGSGSASGSTGGSLDAQLVGTDAVRGTATQGVGAARDRIDRTRSSASALTGRARDTAGTVRDRASGAANAVTGRAGSFGGTAAGNASGSGAGSLSTLGGSASGMGNLALAGSGAANAGAFPVDTGMVVRDAKGRAIGTVQSVRTAGNGALERVLVKVGNKTADLPAANFSGSGSALVSATGKGEVKKAAD